MLETIVTAVVDAFMWLQPSSIIIGIIAGSTIMIILSHFEKKRKVAKKNKCLTQYR